MASQNLTDYERKRLENIRRNDEMLAALKIHSKASEVSAAAKRSRGASKSYTVKSEKKPKTETPVVIRRSLRTRGMPPDSEGLKDVALDSVSVTEKSPAKVLGPLSMRDAYEGDEFDGSFVEAVLGLAKKEAQSRRLNGEEIDSCADGDDFKERSVGTSCDLESKNEEYKVGGSVKLESLTLDSENIARIVPVRITAARFFPSSSVKMVVAGDKFGNLGFWDCDSGGNEGNEVHLYHPHPAAISGILVQRHCLSKIYTSCYDGLVRLMDAEKEIFDLVFKSDESLYSLSQPNNDANCLYFGKGPGGLTIWDSRTGKCTSQWVLHDSRINTIDFNPENFHIMATSSSDGTACTWDLRYNKKSKPSALRTFTHRRAVHSAYFSPSGRSLATTSLDDTIGIYDGANFENASTLFHFNQTGRWLSTFRGIWGWDDSYIFVGNMKRGVDVISPVHKKIIMTLQSPHMSAIPCRFDAHPFEIGTLAGATSGGQVYMWTSS
ncbi:WD repeat-containing protein 76 [Neltuma alba]|uniref:WD repeat-containing protein 76 n=1 Tax=Neltuma alba TaxID=207710 RepID=UPI0010A54AA1|nr:WD repeat-containing protein 76 [Prosopis alba]